jgi:O-antigen ligase
VVSLSFFFAIVLPNYGIDQTFEIGAWQGVFVRKNVLAEAAVLAVLVFLFVRPLRRPLRWLGISASIALLFLSRSATGMVVCAGIVAMLALYRLIGARNAIAIPFATAGLLAVGLILFQDFTLGETLRLVDRSPDLTGRTDLWTAVLTSISKRPYLGYGFGAFWQGMKGESGSILLKAGWTAGYAHNGFLDLVLHVGVLGLVTFSVGYLVFWRRAFKFLSSGTRPIPAWPCAFLAFMLAYNLTEGSILAPYSVYWILYTSTAVSLSAVSFRRVHTRTDGQRF